MSPALSLADRLRRTERFISFIRLGVVSFNTVMYLTLSPTREHNTLAMAIIVIAGLYALVTVFWNPEQLSPTVVPVVNMVLDNVLIAIWLYATGGYDSPFFMLFYAEAAATVGRFGWKFGTAAAAGSGLLYLTVVLVDGGGPPYQVISRFAYIFFIVAFVAYVVEAARHVELDAMAAEATTEAYEELGRLKAAFVSTISHELRTPLTTIRGATTTLLKNEDRFDSEQVRTLLEMVERQSAHLGRMIQDVIDIATLEQGEIDLLFDWCNLEDLLKEELKRVGDIIPQEIRFSATGGIDEIKCDKALVSRAFRNLLDNASKFSSPKDPIDIELTQVGEQVCVDFVDRGIGIGPNEQERIFDRFYQIDSSLTRKAQGSGIGLNIARELVRLHRGDIRVTSAEGDGSRFRVVLPKDPDVLPAKVLQLTGSPEPLIDRARAR